MDAKKLQFRIWALNESILHLGDVYERAKTDEFRHGVHENIKRLEAEKAELLKQWRMIENV